jgi:hypothetical protein
MLMSGVENLEIIGLCLGEVIHTQLILYNYPTTKTYGVRFTCMSLTYESHPMHLEVLE